jgi:hypothetical protein
VAAAFAAPFAAGDPQAPFLALIWKALPNGTTSIMTGFEL